MKYALVNSLGLVENVILLDPDSDWEATSNLSLVIAEGTIVGPGWSYLDGEFIAPGPQKSFIARITKVRFGELFTMDEHARMNLIRWQCKQMDATERSMPENPLTYAETLFFKFDLPAEFIELDLPMIADGLGLLGMLGVFGENAAIRIPQILTNELP